MRKLLFSIIGFAIVAGSSNVASAQILRDLFKEIDRNRPRGQVLKKIFGEDQPDQRQTNSRSRDQKTNANTGRQPTPAQRSTTQTQQRNQNQWQQGAHSGQRTRSQNNYHLEEPVVAKPNEQPNVRSKPLDFGAKLQNSRNDSGVTITQIKRGSVAYESKFKPGDRIVNFGGIEVETLDDIDNILGILNRGDQIEIEFERDGKTDKKIVQFGEPDPETIDQQSKFSDSRQAPSKRNETSRRSPDDYARIQPPNQPSRTNNQSGAVSVLSNLHEGSAPNTAGHNPIRQRQPSVEELYRVIQEQQNVIRSLESQVEALQNHNRSSNRDHRTPRLAPPRRH